MMSSRNSGDRRQAEIRSAREERMGRNSIVERGSDSKYERSELVKFLPPNGDSPKTGKELGLSPYQNRQHPDQDRYSQGIQHYSPNPRNLYSFTPYSDCQNAEIQEYTPPSIPQSTPLQNDNSYPSPAPSASKSNSSLFCKPCQSQAEAGSSITLCSDCRAKMATMLHRYPQDKSGYESAVAFVSGLLGGAFIAARIVAAMWQFPR